MSQQIISFPIKHQTKTKKPQIENDTKVLNHSNKENIQLSSNCFKENNKNALNIQQENKQSNELIISKQISNSASRSVDIIYSGYFGSKVDDNKTLNNITVEPFQNIISDTNGIVIKDLINEDSVYAFESLHAPVKKLKIDNSTSICQSTTQNQKSFFDLMKNINFSTFNHSNTNMFVTKPKKKIMTTEELLIEKINKEKELLSVLKHKNQISVEKIKNYTPKSLVPTPLTTFQPFNITSNINMLKKKRINNNTEELNEKIKEQMKKKFGENSKFLHEKLFQENNIKYSFDREFDSEIQDLSSVMESVSLTKSRNINSPNRCKPIQKLSLNKSQRNLLKPDKSTSQIINVINKTREEKERIEKENKEMIKKTTIPGKKYYYKGKLNPPNNKKA